MLVVTFPARVSMQLQYSVPISPILVSSQGASFRLVYGLGLQGEFGLYARICGAGAGHARGL